MDAVLVALFTLLVLWGLYVAFRDGRRWLRRRRSEDEKWSFEDAASPLAGADGSDEATQEVREAARELRLELGEYPDRWELETSTTFARAIARLNSHGLAVDALVRLARDSDPWTSRIALAALAGRDDLPADWARYVVRRLRAAPYDQAWLYLRTLEEVNEPVIGLVLSQLEHVQDRDVAELIAARIANGREVVDASTFREHVPLSQAAAIETMFDTEEDLVGTVREAFEAWRTGTVDADFLSQFARTWARPFDSPPALLAGSRSEVVTLIAETVTSEPAQSLLLVGEHGAGKTTLVRAALERLPEHWLVFEATAASVNAYAMFVGELEGRVEQIAEKLRGQDAVWVFPAFEETLYAGRHSQSPTGLLDLLLPHLENGDFRIVAEASPSAYEAILAQRPHVGSVFTTLRVRPLGEAESIAVAAHALEHDEFEADASDKVLAESFELAQQFLPGAAPPGNVVRLLASTAEAVSETDKSEIETADVLATLAKMSGLPLALLDPSAPLELDRVRAFFEERVLGQPEAVECLVERVAMIKAGLTDPTRPLGVFLLVGPTGTGKTEIAKALAEFLFGSPNRMTRLDMTEYQTPESLERLLSDTSIEPQGAPLIASVRKDPFSVVLLDEFEKAAAPILDVFLQVFDDGRLTDRHGRTVDLRRCVIILTSNVGSSLARGPGLGFERAAEPFSPAAIQRAVKTSFRPEFLNRLDRTVVFRPFERAQMRALLEKELAEAARRRGLRGRPWAVEYDESALEFLIDQGFSPELGARPLKRAVERHLLTPLAKAIVDQAVPAGDQFLFVTAPKGKIEVQFVDPDAEEAGGDAPEARPVDHDLDLRSVVLAPRSDRQTTAFLLDELQRIEVAVENDGVAARKRNALEDVSRPGFWDDAGRFEVLAEVEYLDRLDAAFRTAKKLGARLREVSRNGHRSANLVTLLAMRLYVLERALTGLENGDPFDVFLRLRALGGADDADGEEFTRTLRDMYLAWGAQRGMQLDEIDAAAPDECVLAVSGLGAATILALEAGLHVLELVGEETDGGDRPIDRVVVAVELASWSPAPAETVPAHTLVQKAFAGAVTPTQVVRRYRRGPAPLVRDAVRGYRTGRLDRVLGGDFDLF